MPYNESSVTWRLIPVDLPPAKHRWKKFLKKLYENGGNLQEPSGGSSQSTEGSPTPERILKKNILPNGAENITIVVFNKGNNPKPPEKKEKSTRKVRRSSNDVQSSSDSVSSSRPSHSLDNLPSSYQRSNLTDRHDRDRTSNHDRLSSHDRVSSHERSSHSRSRKSWHDDRPSRSEKSRHSADTSKPPLRPWFRSHDMVDDYGHDRHRPPEELPMQYRSAFAANIRISLDSSSPRKVYDIGPTRHRRHSDEPKRNKPYSRPHDSRTPAQERLNRLEKHLKEERDRKMSLEYGDRETSGSDAEVKRRKSPPAPPQAVTTAQSSSSSTAAKSSDTAVAAASAAVVNGGEALECDDEALCVWEVKAEEVVMGVRRNGMRGQDIYSPPPPLPTDTNSIYDRYDKKAEDRPNSVSIHSPSSSDSCQSKPSKPPTELNNSNSSQKDTPKSSSSSSSSSYLHNVYKRKSHQSEDVPPTEKLRKFADTLPAKRQRSTSPEMMDWAPIDPQLIHSEVQELRKNGLVDYSCDSSDKSLTSSLNPNNHSMENIIFIVVDTNVMCTDLIKKLRNTSLAGTELVVYVPWQVLVELDALKSSKREIARQAQRACSVLSDRTSQSSGWLRSQPPSMHRLPVDGFTPESPDDFILLSALQLTSTGSSVILLTNDKNLLAKAEAAGIKNFTEIGLNKIVNSQHHKSVLVDLEKPPPADTGTPEGLMAHRLAEAFKSLLISCLERLKEVRGKLWMLYVAVLPPWSLLDSVKAVRSSWDIICPDSTNHYNQLSLLNSIQHFFTDTSYDKVNVEKLHTLFDECCTLATSLPAQCTKFADRFLSQAKEILDEQLLGSEGPPLTPKLNESYELEDLSSEERASNIIDQFDVFSQKLQTFCFCVYSMRGIDWPMERPNPGENKSFSPDFIREYTPFTVSTLETIISSLSRLSSVEIGQVNSETESIVAIHKCLAGFNQDLYKYSERDVAAFANNPRVRENMDSGIKELKKLMDILNKIV